MADLPTGREAHERFAELVRVEEAKLEAVDKVAAFDAEMQAKGLQITPASSNGAASVEVDQRAVEFLQQWRRDNANPTSQQRQLWEADMAQVLSGRRYGETPEQWADRQRTGAPAPSSSDPVSVGPAPAEVSTEVRAVTPDGLELDSPEQMAEVLKVGASVGVDADTIGAILAEAAQIGEGSLPETYTDQPFQLLGFTIDPRAVGEGFSINRHSTELYAVVRACRTRGVSQGQLNKLMAAYFS